MNENQRMPENEADVPFAQESDDPKRRIVEAARLVFANKGFNGATTRAIAKQADVNIAMVHYYFGTKELLYRRVLASQITEGLQLLRGYILRQPEGIDRLTAVSVAFLEVMRDKPHWVGLIRRELADGGARVKSVIDELGESGLKGIYGWLAEQWSDAVRKGEAVEVQTDFAVQFLISVGYGMLLVDPIVRHVSSAPLDDNDVWRSRSEAFRRLIRRAIVKTEVEN